MTTGSWVAKRLVAIVPLVFAGSVAAGFIRGQVLFLPGLMGMAWGGVLGWLSGRLTRNDPEPFTSFGARGGLSLGASLFYGVVNTEVVSILRAGTLEPPLRWVRGVIGGTRGEPFYGFSKNSLQSVSGNLEGAWWVVFVLVDVALFAFLFLVLSGVGQSEDAPEDQEDAPGMAAGEEIPAPAPVGGPHRRPGLLAFWVFAVAATVALILPGRVELSRFHGGATEDGRNASSSLDGEWRFVSETPFLPPGDENLRFSLVSGPDGGLVGFSRNKGKAVMMGLEPRGDGVFEGTIILGGRRRLFLRMRPSKSGDELSFVLDWPTRTGSREVHARALRRATH